MLRGRIDSAAKKSFLHCAHPKNYVIPPLLPPQRPQLSHRPRAIHRNGSSRPSGSAAALEAPVCALKPLFSQPHSAHNTLNRRGEGAVVATAASAWRPWDPASGLASGSSLSGHHRARDQRETQSPSKRALPQRRRMLRRRMLRLACCASHHTMGRLHVLAAAASAWRPWDPGSLAASKLPL